MKRKYLHKIKTKRQVVYGDGNRNSHSDGGQKMICHLLKRNISPKIWSLLKYYWILEAMPLKIFYANT